MCLASWFFSSTAQRERERASQPFSHSAEYLYLYLKYTCEVRCPEIVYYYYTSIRVMVHSVWLITQHLEFQVYEMQQLLCWWLVILVRDFFLDSCSFCEISRWSLKASNFLNYSCLWSLRHSWNFFFFPLSSEINTLHLLLEIERDSWMPGSTMTSSIVSSMANTNTLSNMAALPVQPQQQQQRSNPPFQRNVTPTSLNPTSLGAPTSGSMVAPTFPLSLQQPQNPQQQAAAQQQQQASPNRLVFQKFTQTLA